MNTAGTELPLVRLDEMSLSLTGNVVECGLLLPTFKSRLTDVHALYRYFIDMGIRWHVRMTEQVLEVLGKLGEWIMSGV